MGDLGAASTRGRPPVHDDRSVLNGILWVLRAGLPPIITPKEWRQEYITLLAEQQRERGHLFQA